MLLNFKNVFYEKSEMQVLRIFLLSFALFSFLFPFSKSYVYAYTIKNPRNVVYLEAIVHVKGNVDFFGTANVLQINVTVPINTSFQESIPLSNICKFVKDKNGNVICEITTHDVSQHYSYDIPFLVKVKKITPYEDNVDSIYYLQATPHIQSDLPIFRRFAENISNNYLTPFEKISSLAIWVNKNLKYDLAYGGKNLDALWVLRNRKGVCAEYSTLFIAFARSLGIPARYVHVYAFGENGWESHAIAEVYINGKWYPVDPLWLEVGTVDATHIYFGKYLDNQVSDNIFIKGYSVSDVIWKNSVSIETKRVEYGTNMQMKLFVFPENPNIGSDVVLIVKERCETPMVDKLDLRTCKGIPIIYSKSPLTRYVICQNNTPVFVYWRLKIYDNLSKEYIYTCPLTVNSLNAYPDYKVINVKVSSEGIKSSSKIEAPTVFMVSRFSLKKIPVLLSKKGPNANYLYAVGKNFMEKEDITPYYLPHTFYFYIQPWKYGKNNVLFFMDDGSNLNTTIFVRKTTEGKINNVIVPKKIPLNGEIKAKINYFSFSYGNIKIIVKGSGFKNDETFYTRPGNNSFSMVIGPFKKQGINEVIIYVYKNTNGLNELIDVKTFYTEVLPYTARINKSIEGVYIHTSLPSICFLKDNTLLKIKELDSQDFFIASKPLKKYQNISIVCNLQEKNVANIQAFKLDYLLSFCPETISQKIIEKTKVKYFVSKLFNIIYLILEKIKAIFDFAKITMKKLNNAVLDKNASNLESIKINKTSDLNINTTENFFKYSVLMGNACLDLLREKRISENQVKTGVVEKYRLNNSCFLYFSKMTLPDPCHKLIYRVEKRYDGYAFIFRSVNVGKSGEVCIQLLVAKPVCIVACGKESNKIEVFYEK